MALVDDTECLGTLPLPRSPKSSSNIFKISLTACIAYLIYGCQRKVEITAVTGDKVKYTTLICPSESKFKVK